jgi:cyanophycin synthetase
VELMRREVEVNLLDFKDIEVNQHLSEDLEMLEAEYNGHKELLLDRDSSATPYHTSIITGDKFLTKLFLQRAGLMVVQGQKFYVSKDKYNDKYNDNYNDNYNEDLGIAMEYAQNALKFPVVVKPVFGSHGDNVHVDLINLVKVKTAIDDVISTVSGRKNGFLIEEQFFGKEYRVFINVNGDYAVLHRDCAHVIGDGMGSIKALAEKETKRRADIPRTQTCLCGMVLDSDVDNYLAKSNKTLEHIPFNGEKVYLRNTSNVAKGATCEDYTEKVHSSVIQIARKVLDVFPGMPYAGVDFLSKDIFAEQTPDKYRIVEVNSVPGIHMHMIPGSGKSRNVASYVADMIFPETRGR